MLCGFILHKEEDMGITIRSTTKSIDMGCGGFYNLRKRIAHLTAPDIGEHYELLMKAPHLAPAEECRAWFDAYDRKIEELDEKYEGKYSDILDFLYESDCEGKISYKTCKHMLEIIGDYDDNILYGYAGRPDCATFKSFKELLQSCVSRRCNMTWW